MKDIRTDLLEILKDWEESEIIFDKGFAEKLFIYDITFPITKVELKYLLNEN